MTRVAQNGKSDFPTGGHKWFRIAPPEHTANFVGANIKQTCLQYTLKGLVMTDPAGDAVGHARVIFPRGWLHDGLAPAMFFDVLAPVDAHEGMQMSHNLSPSGADFHASTKVPKAMALCLRLNPQVKLIESLLNRCVFRHELHKALPLNAGVKQLLHRVGVAADKRLPCKKAPTSFARRVVIVAGTTMFPVKLPESL
jgi:hypothetical protein